MTVVYALAFAVYARLLLQAVVPLVRRRPWIANERAEASVLAGILLVGGSIDLTRHWSTAGSDVAGPSAGTVVGLLILMTAVIASAAWRGHTVHSVRDEDFREALKTALHGGGYQYDIRVDANERPSTLLLGGRWEGVEVAASSRGGYGTVRGKGARGRVVERDLVERMRVALADSGAETHRASIVMQIALVGVFIGFIVVSVL